MTRLAAIMTCHDRPNETLSAVESLFAAQPTGISITAFISDASTNDKTKTALSKLAFPIHLQSVPSYTYWNRGMLLAWRHAIHGSPDFFLWLNDDVVLKPSSLGEMLTLYRAEEAAHGGKALIVGSISDEVGHLVYGGYKRASRMSRLRWRTLYDSESLADTMNGNCVLLPAKAVSDVGLLSPRYRHGFGDIDYGLRARRCGYLIIQTRKAVGRNIGRLQVRSRVHLRLGEIWRLFTHPKALPVDEWFYFCQKHGGFTWPLNFVARYLRSFLSGV